jgi:hypothetical protein
MYPSTKKFRLRLLVFASVIVSSIPFNTYALEKAVKSRHTLAAYAGSFSIKTETGQISSFGALNLAYQFHINRHVSVSGIFNQGLLASSGGASIFTGFDIGGTYCLFSCVQTRQNFDNAVLLDQTPGFGLDLGLYISQRSFQLSAGSVGYTGFSGRATLGYYIFENVRLLLAATLSQLKNFDVSVTESQVLGGVSFDFDF